MGQAAGSLIARPVMTTGMDPYLASLFRVGASGHGVPLAERFGGWHVTGAPGFTNHWGNLTGRLAGGELTTFPNPPGERFNFDKYPVPTSDVLPQLLHEHQAGFVNRVVEASYRARTILHANGDGLSADQITELDEQARILTRYLLFADEALLPAGGIAGEATYRADFLRNRNLEFVKAARALGLSNRQIIWRHVLPNSLTPVITFLPFRMSAAILALTSLDFLGLGVPASVPSLGELLQQGKANLDAWWIIVPTFLLLTLTMLLLTFIGDALRDAFDTRKS